MSVNSQFKASELFQLKDFKAIVTGGGTGIGLMVRHAQKTLVLVRLRKPPDHTGAGRERRDGVHHRPP
jgi:hypothetical protein